MDGDANSLFRVIELGVVFIPFSFLLHRWTFPCLAFYRLFFLSVVEDNQIPMTP